MVFPLFIYCFPLTMQMDLMLGTPRGPPGKSRNNNQINVLRHGIVFEKTLIRNQNNGTRCATVFFVNLAYSMLFHYPQPKQCINMRQLL